MVDIFVGALGMTLFQQINHADNINKSAMEKNSRAFTKMADAERKVAQSKKQLMDAININAVRKKAILNYHIKEAKTLLENFETIILLKRGKGTEELGLIELKNSLSNYVKVQSLASADMMTNSQLAINFAIFGIGGLMIKESKINAAVASQNMSKASAMQAQADTVSISMEGIAERVDMTTQLLEKLGVLQLAFIKQLKEIWAANGRDAEKYTEQDMNIIDLTIACTMVLYRIINAPILDENGKISIESKEAMEKGNAYMLQIDSL